MKGIHFEEIEINFLSNGKAKEITDLICNYVKKSGSDPLQIRGAFEADPLGRLIVNGTICIPVDQGFDFLASLVHSVVALPNFRVVHINASNFTNAGADIVQELAFGISMGSEYMVQLTERGISADEAAMKIRFSFGTGSNYFPEIAKLRAARLLWSAVTKGFHPENPENIKMDIHCVTSEWNKTVYDPYVNLLRTQTEAMSSIIGGTDSLTVEPFDIVFRNPDEFSERIARNQQLILKEEAYFDKVADPAAGSYYIENLTNLISEHAWKLFLEVENKGGFLACIQTGFIQDKLAESSSIRKENITGRKEILLGTNRFPDVNEKAPSGTDLRRVFKAPVQEKGLLIKPIRLFRGSEEYERRRLGSDKAKDI
jgi:methylmalonyl-CoA mutase